jgi:hypothetical protein
VLVLTRCRPRSREVRTPFSSARLSLRPRRRNSSPTTQPFASIIVSRTRGRPWMSVMICSEVGATVQQRRSVDELSDAYFL